MHLPNNYERKLLPYQCRKHCTYSYSLKPQSLCPRPETISIGPSDSRWVGAWWLGYLIAGVLTLLSAIPFWFLPRSLPIGQRGAARCTPEQTSFIKDPPLLEHKCPADEPTGFLEMAKGTEVTESFVFCIVFIYIFYRTTNIQPFYYCYNTMVAL